MEFNELVADFSERHGVSGMTAEDGAAALEIDGITVMMIASADDLMLSAEIGEPPAEGVAVFANLLLEASLQSESYFAKTPDSGSYVLVRRLSLPSIDADAFDAALESLVNQAETWRRMLADFRPVAQAAAEHAEEESQSFGTSGFMQV